MTARIAHETTRRLRIGLTAPGDAQALGRKLGALACVAAVRVNRTARCVVVQHDGSAASRAAILREAGIEDGRTSRRQRGRRIAPPTLGVWLPAGLAAAVPALPGQWRKAGAMAVIAARLAAQAGKLRTDPAGVLLDAAGLTALAAGGQALAVSASVLLRLWSESASQRLVAQSDQLLAQLLPAASAQYRVHGAPGEAWTAVDRLRKGDRLQLTAGDVVPVDGSVTEGEARIALPSTGPTMAAVGPGDAVAAGSRLVEGTLTLHVEAAAEVSRLARIRHQVLFALEARAPDVPGSGPAHRFVSLPLTAAALVLGFTGDSTRAATMLQADPDQGLDLARPVAREAALYALARTGLLTGGLLAIERLAASRVLVLQDTGVVATGRWMPEAIASDLPHERVLDWLTALADTTPAAARRTGFADATVRNWVRHGAVLVLDGTELHLASPRRLHEVWHLPLPEHRVPGGALRRDLVFVQGGAVVARVTLASPLRTGALDHLAALRRMAFERIALFEEDPGEPRPSPPPEWAQRSGLEVVAAGGGLRPPWLAEAASAAQPLVFVHTALRDLLPAGSLSLTPLDADAGSHGVLLDDPLASLVRARRVARQVHRRLRRQETAALLLNAGLMTSSALRWLPPMGSVLAHHGFALALLLDSHRLEKLAAPEGRPEFAEGGST